MDITTKQKTLLDAQGIQFSQINGQGVISLPVDLGLGTQDAPLLPKWVFEAIQGSRVCYDTNLTPIKAMVEMFATVSEEFFWAGYMSGIEAILFDALVEGPGSVKDWDRKRRGELDVDKTAEQIIFGDDEFTGFPALAVEAQGWYASDIGWIPMLQWLLSRYNPQSVLHQVFAAGLGSK